MTGNKLAHLSCTQVPTRPNGLIVVGPLPKSDTETLVRKNSDQRLDDLMRKFSDVAFSGDEEEHAWESWNYSRISTF